MNRVILTGKLGRDPEVKHLNNAKGTIVAKFSMVTDSWRLVDGKFENDPSWHSIVAFGKIAEKIEKQLFQGCQVLVEGSLKYGEYTKKDSDVKVKTTDIIADKIECFDKKPASRPPSSNQETTEENYHGDNSSIDTDNSSFDDLPF